MQHIKIKCILKSKQNMIYFSKFHCLPTGICNSLVLMVCFRLSNSFNQRAGGNGADSSSGHTELLCGWTCSTTPLMCGKSPCDIHFFWFSTVTCIIFVSIFCNFVFLMLAFAVYFDHDLWIIHVSAKGIHWDIFSKTLQGTVLEMLYTCVNLMYGFGYL